MPLPAIDAPSPEPIQDPQRYLLPGDTIRLKFPYHPELDEKVPVQPDGRINVPYVGEVDATSVTIDELANVIRTRASDRLRDPQVEVLVAELGDQRVYVGGEVYNPGLVRYHDGMTPLEAILDRGGFTYTARVDYVVHLIAQPQQYLATRLDLSPSLQSASPPVHLAANDILYVPRNTIGDIDAFMKLYVLSVLPIPPGVGVGFHPAIE
ncbi:MAG TPA: polysaccharide biosynthesis/export family protein [Candidatus Kryptonia bacterium]|nr:polysaccharide biosynthesis/export family protein [Candidatus Kryptonia bacterium]